MENLAVGQLFYLIQTALEYLYKQKALQVKNEKFINTNLLKNLRAVSRTSNNWALGNKHFTKRLKYLVECNEEVLLFKFLGYDESIFFQPIWKSWRKIEPRLNFYSVKRCMYCGSNDLYVVDYDGKDYVSLILSPM